MIKSAQSTFFTLALFLLATQTQAEQTNNNEALLTTVNLKYVTGSDVVSVLETLIDQSVSISEENNALLIKGAPNKTKNILSIINKIDTPAVPLTIEFIASNRKIEFKKSSTTYQSNKSKNNTSQSMSITERQWVTLNTGLSIPIAERKHYADGTETQSFRYKKISKQYVFKVHEFAGWSVVQVGLNTSSFSDDVAGAIAHTKLSTTIVGKTGEWLEVTSSNPVTSEENSQTYSTNRSNSNNIFLYVKIKKNETNSDIIIENKTNTEITK